MKKKILLWCIIGVFLGFVSVVSAVESVHEGVSDGIVRLHIIANSDSSADQKIKLLVRDAIISGQKEIFKDGLTKTLNNEEKEKLRTAAEKVLEEECAGYGANVEAGKFYFPVKAYENITLPAGEYDAVRVVLGAGAGKNWWCVMYPPLCFGESYVGKMETESLDILKEEIGEADYEIISGESIKIVPAFKLAELWQIVKENIKKSL